MELTIIAEPAYLNPLNPLIEHQFSRKPEQTCPLFRNKSLIRPFKDWFLTEIDQNTMQISGEDRQTGGINLIR